MWPTLGSAPRDSPRQFHEGFVKAGTANLDRQDHERRVHGGGLDPRAHTFTESSAKSPAGVHIRKVVFVTRLHRDAELMTRYACDGVAARACTIPMEEQMYIAIAHFPTVPAERDNDFRDWFAWSNEQLRHTAGLKDRRLLRAQNGSYIALVEHESASTFAAMHSVEAVSMIHAGLGSILSDGPQATKYDVVVGFSTSGGCCSGGMAAARYDGAAQTQVVGGCCQEA